MIEAEDGRLTAPLQRLTDPRASGGAYVAVEDGTGTARQGEVSLDLDVAEAGEVAIWARVRAPSTDSNSFFVALDGAQRWIWHAPGPNPDAVAPDWTWARIPTSDGDALHRLSAGAHRLQVTNRQDGTHLDAVAVTSGAAPPDPPP